MGVMRSLPLLALLLLPAGCGPTPIALVFTGATSTQSGIGYNADIGTAADVDGELVMTSSAGGATFRVSCDPQNGPATVMHGDQHLSVEYNIGNAGWANDGGSITFTTVNPY